VDLLVLLSPAGLAPVKLTLPLLARSTAWLLRPSTRRSARLVELMAGEQSPDDVDVLVEWMTLVARSTRTTGSPGPLPDAVLERWQGADVRALVGEHDAFFPPSRLETPVRDRLGTRLQVVAGAGHLLVDQGPDVVVDAVAGGPAA
jgi:pimeloyl-ACP methyl ester carboxylesterase